MAAGLFALGSLVLLTVCANLATAEPRRHEPHGANLAFVPATFGAQDAGPGAYGSMQELPLARLMRRQSEYPYPVKCPDGETCCPAGSNCRPDLGLAKCCPTSANTCGGKGCATAGSTCCGNPPIGVCDAGLVCHPKGGCCREGWTICEDAVGKCCPPGEQCTSDGRCGAGSTDESTTVLSTLTSLSTGTVIETLPTGSGTARGGVSGTNSAPNPTETSEDEEPDEPDDNGTPTSSGASPTSTDACATGAPSRRSALSARQAPAGCSTECHNGQNLPVVTFYNTPQTRELIVSMCSGISTTGGGRGGDDSFDVLTYDPSGKKARRRQAQCARFCAQQARVFNDPTKLECDEYPFAMAKEGGTGAHRTCVEASQNSGTQGPILSRFISACNLQAGQQFVVRIDGGCSSLRSGKRDVAFSASNSTLLDPTGHGGLTYVAVPVGNLQNGHYSLNMVIIAGSVDYFSVMDKEGEVFANQSSPGQLSLAFDVADLNSDDEVPAVLIGYASKAANVSFDGRAPANPSGAARTASELTGLVTVGVMAIAVVALIGL